jgi:hypothetical protein
MHARIEAESAQRPEIQIEDRQRRRFDDDLELVVVLQAERIVAITAVGRPARRLDEG